MPTQEQMTKAIYEAMFPPKKEEKDLIEYYKALILKEKVKRLSKSKN